MQMHLDVFVLMTSFCRWRYIIHLRLGAIVNCLELWALVLAPYCLIHEPIRLRTQELSGTLF